MPVYTIKDTQTGRQLKVSGATPPSEADIDELFQANTPKTRSIQGFLGNVINSGGRAVGDLVSGAVNVFNPNMEENTVANVAKLGGDSIGALFGDRDVNNRALQLIDYYKTRYGKDISKTLYEDPIGVLLDASTVLGGGGAVLKGAGTAGKIGKLTKAGNIASKASALTDPMNAVSRGFGKVIRKAVPSRQTISQKLRKGSEDIVTRGLGNPATQDKFLRKGRTTAGETFERYNLYDRDPATATAAKQQVMTDYDTIAKKSGNKVSMADILQSVDDEIAKIQKDYGFTDSGQAQIKELQRRKQQVIDYVGASDIDNASPIADVERLTTFRQGLDKDIPASMFGLDPKGSGTAQGAKVMRDLLRKTINSSDPRLERLGLDYGVLKGYEDVFSKAQQRSNNRQMVNFTKLGTAGVGGLLGGIPGAVGGFAVEQIANSPQFARAASKGLRKASEIVEKGRMPKVPKNVFRAMSIGSGSVKGERMLSPEQLSKKQSTSLLMPDEVQQAQMPQQQKSNTLSTRSSYAPTKLTVNIPKKKKDVAFGGKVKLSKSNAY